MIHVIIDDNKYPTSGRVVMIGDDNKFKADYRLLTRIMCDKYGVDEILEATLGLAHDDISHVSVVIKEEKGGKL